MQVSGLVHTRERPWLRKLIPAGIPEYGCAISPEKRLTNFDICLDEGEVVPPLAAGEGATFARRSDGRLP